ncbi:sensor histidine kinase [Dapis sp. BLCC M126]|uniref:sensor histidine kinase n=1 Tax=Dapis sp. BLCC M126 TaxID=3400189 RepID=UPI003CE76910
MNKLLEEILILSEILILTRVESGQLEFDPASIDVIIFCHQLIKNIQVNTRRKHKFTFVAQGKLEDLYLDKKLLHIILNNLLSHAIKYSSNDSNISLEVFRESEKITFCISNQGIGIPGSSIKQLFKQFERTSNVGVIDGTGLSLSIVKQAVDLHGGYISIDRTEGVGTTIKVTLPCTTI